LQGAASSGSASRAGALWGGTQNTMATDSLLKRADRYGKVEQMWR
jgi:hypothetical protein